MKEVEFKVDGIKYVGWDSFTDDEAEEICNKYGLQVTTLKHPSGFAPYAGLAKVNGNYRKTPGLLPNTPSCTNNSKYSDQIKIPPTVVNDGKNYLIVEIGKRAFYNAQDVSSVTLPDSIRRIETSAFLGSTHICRINFPKNLWYIGNGAFTYCYGLVRIVLPDNLRELQRGTVLYPGDRRGGEFGIFCLCKNLEDLTIGSGMEKMDQAFYECNELKTIICKAATPPTITEGTFSQIAYQKATLYVPFSSLKAYKKATYWKEFDKIEPIPETIPENGENANENNPPVDEPILISEPIRYITLKNNGAFTASIRIKGSFGSRVVGKNILTMQQKTVDLADAVKSIKEGDEIEVEIDVLAGKSNTAKEHFVYSATSNKKALFTIKGSTIKNSLLYRGIKE